MGAACAVSDGNKNLKETSVVTAGCMFHEGKRRRKVPDDLVNSKRELGGRTEEAGGLEGGRFVSGVSRYSVTSVQLSKLLRRT